MSTAKATVPGFESGAIISERCAGVVATACTRGKRTQHGGVSDDQPDAREGQAGCPGVAERFAVPLKPGNAGGGKSAAGAQAPVRQATVAPHTRRTTAAVTAEIIPLPRERPAGIPGDQTPRTIVELSPASCGWLNLLPSSRCCQLLVPASASQARSSRSIRYCYRKNIASSSRLRQHCAAQWRRPSRTGYATM
jgi:hypothetical protein